MDSHEEIKTNFGIVRVLATDAKHIYVNTPEYSTITVNNVNYYLSAHIYKWEDGHWHFGPSREQAYSEPSMRRAEPTGNRDYNPSYAAKEKARTVLLAAVLGWIDANPEALRMAEVDDLQKQINKLYEERKELTEKIDANVEKSAELSRKMGTLNMLAKAS